MFPINPAQEHHCQGYKQYYYNRRTAPKYIFLPFELEDIDLFAQLLEQQFQKKATFKVPKRGDKLRLIELANQNAKEEVLRVTKLDESHNATLLTLRKMLGIASLNRIESFDISNISGTDNVAAMVVFENGKPRRSEYKRFRTWKSKQFTIFYSIWGIRF